MKSQIDINPLEWDIIETYLDQNEASDNATMLNEKLTQIPDVKKKIEHIKKVKEEIEDSIRQSKIKEFHSQVRVAERGTDVRKLPARNLNSKILWYSIAAVMVGLIGIFWMMQSNSTSEKIFAENFKPDIGLPLKMGATNNLEFYEGMLDYKQENYNEAIAKWEVLIKDNPENDTVNYFLGVANLALGNADKSLKFLQNETRFQQGIFKEDAAYYTALAKIKKGEFEEAKILLNKYPSDRNTKLLKLLQEE
ncbi:hypothetical protein Aeqsu_1671 [Aequorivita sublithincola DSM 14238]|uniref:Uncharacterized protein n=1 Tax=Aequorivita sublithincola (strain DSM 14238 / LMG 21431 / ACAM 643 / 9-3) TaxID=746697 RepID=I3YVY6_AEQSU|nr:tetratricopeptide repeat protein [Aequorivita sublithincola]AFL81154.1 hypothetical protein Aeqsu_1671 [Aequorivita sublithincola DSM 14238]